jgi:multidrug resistance efflux pump
MQQIDERIKALEAKLKQAKATKRQQDARIKSAETKKARADDTRRKILLGALMLEMMRDKPEFSEEIHAKLKTYLTRTDDLALFASPEGKSCS